MNPAGFGLLCSLPLAAAFLARYRHLRSGMGRPARRRFSLKAIAFLLGSAAASAVLYAHRGSRPLPLLWSLLLVILAATSILGLLKRNTS